MHTTDATLEAAPHVAAAAGTYLNHGKRHTVQVPLVISDYHLANLVDIAVVSCQWIEQVSVWDHAVSRLEGESLCAYFGRTVSQDGTLAIRAAPVPATAGARHLDDDEPLVLSRAKVLAAIPHWIQWRNLLGLPNVFLGDGSLDADQLDADVIVQFALFDQVVYA